MSDENYQNLNDDFYSNEQEKIAIIIAEIQELPMQVVINFLNAQGSLKDSEYLTRFIDDE